MTQVESRLLLELVVVASSFSLTFIFAVIFGCRGCFLNQSKKASLKMKGYERNLSQQGYCLITQGGCFTNKSICLVFVAIAGLGTL